MLDTDTKRRIDTARDILVGKVPDPKSQVEQITIALIYKFMDDMDAESEEFGGKRKFFAGEFARYGWAKLMRSRLGGHETLNLYAEAIAKMPENPGIPPLFRDIFKNAYLPYRDPETLRAFLKIIDEFNYDHSERLGDAFEYLLSVLGSQGDAGQFRTPRHIIDFIVAIIDPKKTETVLDPACGTAGFLISSYKHILGANKLNMDKQDGQDENEQSCESCPSMFVSSLTPDEKARLAQNFKGYDISPDMVRLSLVNLYLHGFADPHIAEYDTLTSQDRWNEYADVILANPPFMSPKGGIKPHNRFSVQSKRSEVLFVDYMAEHLTSTGRAGIIVPEGIIFQSQTAYKQLRKMLVENSLVAVVSLPAGCFNPYSGVKTSILILDKSLARQSDTIAFFKVENDGYGLGAQRRAIEKNDLPQVQAELAAYLHALRSKAPTEIILALTSTAQIVPKEKIAANGDYNLSGERYREGVVRSGRRWPTVPLSDVCSLQRGLSYSTAEIGDKGNGVPFYNLKSIKRQGVPQRNDFKYFTGEVKDRHLVEPGDVLIALTDLTPTSELIGSPKLITDPTKAAYSADLGKLVFKVATVQPQFLYHLLRSNHYREYIVTYSHGANVKHLQSDGFYAFQIPLPPLEVQKEIVAEIEGYQKVINGARAVLDSYRPHIPIHPDWPIRELGGLAENLDSQRVPITKGDRKAGPFPYYGASGIVDRVANYIFDEDILLISEDGANLLARSTPIAFSVAGKCWVNNHAHVLNFAHPATQKFVEVYLNSISIEEFVTGAAQPKLNQEALNRIPIPLPDDVATQQAIVAEIEAEQALVAANRELIERFEKKIQATLARVWGEEPGACTK
ncbi:MAG: N-6 DNA methylase [Gammaproteobacteria bacterium]|nr:N-6 DNA methylase [Gammaproteobacteria bacterium]